MHTELGAGVGECSPFPSRGKFFTMTVSSSE